MGCTKTVKKEPREEVKRAIAISGGGPTLGIAIGALESLQTEGIQFDVYSCACIGSWVVCIYLSKDGTESKAGIEHLKKVYQENFRPDEVYKSYPFASFFQPDIKHYLDCYSNKVLDKSTYEHLFLPDEWLKLLQKWMQSPGSGDMLSFLNDFYPLNPVIRFWSEVIFKSSLCGLVKQPNADALAAGKIDFAKLNEATPRIYTNAYCFEKQAIVLFTNKAKHESPASTNGYDLITADNLMAGSSLPYIYEPRPIDGQYYCEGATVDTVNFKSLLDNHPDLEEVWVLKIVDYKQMKRPQNLVEGLSNFPMIFADTVADDDIKLFRYHLLEEEKFDLKYEKAEYEADSRLDEYDEKMKPTLWKSCQQPDDKQQHDDKKKIKLVTIRVNYKDVNFDWNQANLKKGIKAGRDAANRRVDSYREYMKRPFSLSRGT